MPQMIGEAVVLLSVGGKRFATTCRTLTSHLARDSMLESLVNLHMEGLDSYMRATCRGQAASLRSDPRHPDAMFIDRDGDNFGYILNYLRDGPEMVLPADLHTTQLVLKEARYYRLTGLIELLEDQAMRLKEAEAQKHKQELQKLECLGRITF